MTIAPWKPNDCLQIKVKSNEQSGSEMNKTGKVTFLPLMIYSMHFIIHVYGTISSSPLVYKYASIKNQVGP